MANHDPRRATQADPEHPEQEAQLLELLNKVGVAVAAELNLDRAVQIVTDAATELTGAAFGAFFYNVIDAAGESYTLYALSGAPRSAFEKFPMPRNTAVFAPTFEGTGIVRSDDILADPRYGKNEPYFGMPKGHLPVRSYLAAPVVSRSGEVMGGLFFGHPEPGRFGDRAQRLVVGIAAQAAAAIDNARLFQAAEREVAERRRAEAALQALNATLEQRVAEAVEQRAKAEHQLRQVQKMEAVGQLTGGIAHDFNNMLAVIIGGLNLMQRKLDKGETDVGRFIEAATDAAQRAAALTKRLLAFARQQPLSAEPISLNRMIAGMEDLLARSLGEHIKLGTALHEGLWPVKADAGLMENAILNLAVNARDAMEEGGRLDIVTGHATLDFWQAKQYAVAPGDYVTVAVSDTGSGMAPETIAQAFDPFFTTKGGAGTGLGLAQVYGLVRQAGGHVQIKSAPGQGTTVTLYLPRYREGQEAAAPVPVAVRTAAPRRGLRTELVLVVEDEERVRTVSVAALQELGYSVLEADSPAQALDLIERGQRVSLLFTDMVMPDMSGRELTQRAQRKLPGLKVLYTTGYTRGALGQPPEPGLDVLSKPYSLDELAAKVRQVLDR